MNTFEVNVSETEKVEARLLDTLGNPWVSVTDEIQPDGSTIRRVGQDEGLFIPAKINLALE